MSAISYGAASGRVEAGVTEEGSVGILGRDGTARFIDFISVDREHNGIGRGVSLA